VASESPLERLRRLEAGEKLEPLDPTAPPGGPGSAQPRPAPPAKSSPARQGFFGAIFAAIVLLITKGKVILLFVLKFLPTFATMAISIWAYATYFGWPLAVGIVVEIFIHECGHALAALRMGEKSSLPLFIPFAGGFVRLKRRPPNSWVDFVIGYGGPLFGLLAGLVALGLAEAMPTNHLRGLFCVLAWFAFIGNFFNLIPLGFLDGARISAPFRYWYWFPGCALIIGLPLLLTQAIDTEAMPYFTPMMFMTIVLVGMGLYRAYKAYKKTTVAKRLLDRLAAEAEEARYPTEALVTDAQRRTAAFAYFILAGVLCTLMFYTNYLMPSLK